MCAFASSFIKALDVIAAACPLPDKRHHMFGPSVRCGRLVASER